MARKAQSKIVINERECAIIALALRELLYLAEEGSMKELFAENDWATGRAPDVAEVGDLLARVDRS